ncbi:serine/threonine-protein kinase EDR1 isoform X2 [Amborella trichopoda]|uniref:serine/threonine-protein kinase EDR1 isoform X2 n=1 Tax=Amborella trichopoda TaxID=13333 RepID=UPI0009BE775B|nr:serine/threonine-protein kinase EDR1 isoform X2 [Amborella trichopoda]|eukprot:XP_020531650.1 serine/threonine-protein kinase EDR1 isoform X2 [Amborella trichopoda]
MSKMKYFLRKLRIGGSGDGSVNNNRGTTSSSSAASSSLELRSQPEASISSSSPATLHSDRISEEAGVDYNLVEEEYQVQLALAISASDPGAGDDPDSLQIKAAKRISMGFCPSPGNSFAELLSHRYWTYNVVNYDEKVMDGFYDVYGIFFSHTVHGKMPSLMELQATSITDNVDYEVVLVNRAVDPALEQLEKKATCIASECRATERGPLDSGLVQKLADLVADRMGGQVCDSDDMLRRWTIKSYELRTSLNTIIFPLGILEFGLSRHRALLFKVLADKINLPCRLMKGSYYTGTDEGAVNMIRINHECEFLIDLMAAPGTLIPTEIPGTHCQQYQLDDGRINAIGMIAEELHSLDTHVDLDNGSKNERSHADTVDKIFDSRVNSSNCLEPESFGSRRNDINLTDKNKKERFEREFGMLLPSLRKLGGGPSANSGAISFAQKMKVKDVSKYVISAAQHPEFAHKLHAVLLESGAQPPPDIFSDIKPFQKFRELSPCKQVDFAKDIGRKDPGQDKHHLPVGSNIGTSATNSSSLPVPSPKSAKLCDPVIATENATNEYVLNDAAAKQNATSLDSSHLSSTNLYGGELRGPSLDLGKRLVPHVAKSSQQHSEMAIFGANTNCYKEVQVVRGKEKIEEILGIDTDYGKEVAKEPLEWEIRWEDLQIGERIGLGSYGEVYHADWNGTEVAVKKFLDQDISGYALEQFRYEVNIMLRLRHPNVVLFMGAVTCPPNLSILTGFLPRGSLYRLLHHPNVQIDEKRRLRMALDVAKGMNYLHTSHPTIVHRDLKSLNLLVDKNWVVKVCDFGFSRLKHHTFLSANSTAGTPEWMAPEVLRNEPSNEKCDVYSFGVILWELATTCMPWSGMNAMQVVGAVGFQNRHLDIPKEVDPKVAQIIFDCWQSDPALRPSFGQLIAHLKQLQRLNVD